MWTYFGVFREINTSRYARGVCTTHIVAHRWGEAGEKVVPSGLCQGSCMAAPMVQEAGQFLLSSCGPFLPYSPECVGGRLAEKYSPFFLSLDPFCAGSLMG
jgi:hypothetical protein